MNSNVQFVNFEKYLIINVPHIKVRWERIFILIQKFEESALYKFYISVHSFLRIVGSVCSRYYLAIQINLLLHHGCTSRSATLMSAVQSFSVFFFHSFGGVVLSLYIQINCFLLEMNSWLELDEDKKIRLLV